MSLDVVAIQQLVERLIKDYETAETHCTLFYSTDKSRDYAIMNKKVKRYREKLGKLLANGQGDVDTTKTRITTREADI